MDGKHGTVHFYSVDTVGVWKQGDPSCFAKNEMDDQLLGNSRRLEPQIVAEWSKLGELRV